MIMMTMLMVSVKVTVMDRLVAELALPCNTGWPNFFIFAIVKDKTIKN